MSVNPYDHEDAFKAANLCAGRKTRLADALMLAASRDQAQLIIADAQAQYQRIFDAFIEGVAYGRENPKTPKESA